jgi:hypothetical protein
LWFKLKCYYHAKTELYDRTLTDMRERYDPTSAYVDASLEVRRASDFNAQRTYRYISDIADAYHVRHHSDMLKNYELYYTAQGWIDLYNYLVENGEMEYMNAGI